MVWKRSAGAFRRQRVIIRSSSGAVFSGRASSRTIAAITAIPVSAENARCPESISYNTSPNEKMSDRASSGLACACSGDIYATVPATAPACDMLSVSSEPS